MTIKNKETEKVYITRDEDDKFIFVWRKPSKGSWAPKKVKDCETVNYQREDRSLDNVTYYLAKNFKKVFGITIRAKTKKCIHLDKKLLNCEDYKEVSNDPDRKK